MEIIREQNQLQEKPSNAREEEEDKLQIDRNLTKTL